MKDKKSFEEISREFQSDDSQGFKKLYEEARDEKRKLNKIQLIICLIVDIIMIYIITGGFKTIDSIIIVLVPIIIIDSVICLLTYSLFGKKQREYRKEFKKIIIKRLMGNFYDDLEYFPNKGMPERIYKEARFKEYYNRYYSDDYLEAKIDNQYDIDMAEIETQEVTTEKDSDGNTHTETETIFHGLFAKIIIDKSILSELRIKPDSRFNIGKGKDKLEMDSR